MNDFCNFASFHAETSFTHWAESNWKVGREGTAFCLKKFSASVKDWIIAVPLNSYIVLINLFKCEFSQKIQAGIVVTGMLSTQN